MTTQRTIETYLMDMDGVLVHEERLIPGADLFIKRLQQTDHRFGMFDAALQLVAPDEAAKRDAVARLGAAGTVEARALLIEAKQAIAPHRGHPRVVELVHPRRFLGISRQRCLTPCTMRTSSACPTRHGW